MKQAKKLLAFLLVAVLVISLGSLTAFAADDDPVKNDSITINNAKVGETYAAYKMFDLTVDDEFAPSAWSYKVNSDWADFFKAAEDGTPAGAGNQYVTINDAGYVTAISDPAALAKAAAEWTGKPKPAKSVKVNEGETTAVLSGLEDGYWLVTSTLGTIAMADTTPDNKAVTINEKNPEDTIEKKVKEDSTGTFGKNNDAQVGDVVEFKSTVKIVKGTRNVVVHDKMDSGLDYTEGSVAIEGLTKGTEFTVNESPDDGDTFDITFDQDWIDGLDFGTDGYKEFEITYTAKLNENAVVKGTDGVAIVDQNNKTHVSFGDKTDSTEDTTTTTTHKFEILKHNSKNEVLAGAKFKLYIMSKAAVEEDKENNVEAAPAEYTEVKVIKLDDNNYRVAKEGEEGVEIVTVKTGNIVVWGIDSDTYYLEETEAPDGYNKLTEKQKVTVNSENNTVADVLNQAGTELPSTGGIGTTIFYVVGGLLLVGAGVLLVTKKRVGNDG